jgi:hypothetical protein
MLSLFPWTRTHRAKKLARETDFGRRFGWFIERERRRIGELDYIRWDSLAQFWHEYSVKWHDGGGSCISANPEAWINSKVALRNRHYTDVLIQGSMVAPRAKGVIALRYASVPVERFERDETV